MHIPTGNEGYPVDQWTHCLILCMSRMNRNVLYFTSIAFILVYCFQTGHCMFHGEPKCKCINHQAPTSQMLISGNLKRTWFSYCVSLLSPISINAVGSDSACWPGADRTSQPGAAGDRNLSRGIRTEWRHTRGWCLPAVCSLWFLRLQSVLHAWKWKCIVFVIRRTCCS